MSVAADYVSRHRTMPAELHGTVRGYLYELWREVPGCGMCRTAWLKFGGTAPSKYARSTASIIEKEIGRR